MNTNNTEENGYYFFCKGNEKLDIGEIKEAIHFYLKSAEMAPHFKTYERLYECYVRLKEFELAHYFISMAYECNNKNDYVSYVYSKSLLNDGKKDKAEQILMDILKRNPDYKKARKELNLLYNGQ